MEAREANTLPYNAFEQALREELQLLRTNPAAYARILETERKPLFKGTEVHIRGERRRDDIIEDTHEGSRACDEAIAFLQSARPLPRLNLSAGLSLAAKKSLNEVGQQGGKTCDSTAYLSDFGRLEPGGTAVEVATFGGRSARDMMIHLVICDGDSERSQRRDIFGEWSEYGVAVGRHKSDFKRMAIVNFATKYTDKRAVLQQPLDAKYRYYWEVNEPL